MIFLTLKIADISSLHQIVLDYLTPIGDTLQFIVIFALDSLHGQVHKLIPH